VDELYVIARRVLLDALDALGEHKGATILVGAQAIYLHTGDADLGIAEYTTDADLAFDPDLLAEIPPLDPRVVRAKVAGPGALLVAKMFKIHERRGSARANDKDALDVLRVLQGVSTEDLARRLKSILADERSATTGARALELFTELFGNRGGEGAAMAARAAQPVMDADQVRVTCEALAGDLLEVLKP
jgi:hypothetical protein